MLSVVMLNAVMLSVIMLSIVAPLEDINDHISLLVTHFVALIIFFPLFYGF